MSSLSALKFSLTDVSSGFALIADEVTAADGAAAVGLTTGGLLVMVVSIGCVLSMLAYCLFKVFTLPPAE